ncbi:2'-5' RNA ligase family protein [Silvimonas iriomotensis]|uniref:RNA 2',3'-cyclic phosphodiesterase n=1 Tax=Silvimonas iriomotensis TaxID=449662 RepID=A0ABQ2PD54_9NEIS|nr:hypothetical protein [Silvimonas iriomotensis]GGP23167.1 RNA 2',3'-cyclic phosphodiesterase [Silvimonas iriomotensis]
MDRGPTDLFAEQPSLFAGLGASHYIPPQAKGLPGIVPRRGGLGGMPLGNLFFAIFPSAAAIERIHELAVHECHVHALAGYFIGLERLHMSIAPLLTFPGEVAPRLYIDAGIYLGNRIQMNPFMITLDHTANFQGRSGRSPYVMTAGAGREGAIKLSTLLAMELRRVGVKFSASSVNPHVTMLYDRKRPPPCGVDPVSWLVTDFALVHSHVGESRYDILQRWTLGG